MTNSLACTKASLSTMKVFALGIMKSWQFIVVLVRFPVIVFIRAGDLDRVLALTLEPVIVPWSCSCACARFCCSHSMIFHSLTLTPYFRHCHSFFSSVFMFKFFGLLFCFSFLFHCHFDLFRGFPFPGSMFLVSCTLVPLFTVAGAMSPCPLRSLFLPCSVHRIPCTLYRVSCTWYLAHCSSSPVQFLFQCSSSFLVACSLFRVCIVFSTGDNATL